ncbi:hypothetical protein ACTFIT_006340 [Dictyostelium discoideum]
MLISFEPFKVQDEAGIQGLVFKIIMRYYSYGLPRWFSKSNDFLSKRMSMHHLKHMLLINSNLVLSACLRCSMDIGFLTFTISCLTVLAFNFLTLIELQEILRSIGLLITSNKDVLTEL